MHREQNTDLIAALDAYYRDRADVYVSGNLLLFHEEGNRRGHRSPDVLVTLGIEKRQRDHYLLWVEGKAPDFIIEVTSMSTRTEDTVVKKRLYGRIGVREYFIFDPLREYQDPMLQGFRRSGRHWRPILAVPGHPVRSKVLGLELLVVDKVLRLRDPANGELLRTPRENEAARRAAEAACQEAEAAREKAEEAHERDRRRLLALELELKQLRGEI